MTRILAIVLLLVQASATKVLPATDVKASDIQATVKEEIAKKLTDVPIRTVDAGGHNISVAVVHRDKGTNLTGIDPQTDEVTELFHPRRQNWKEHFEWQGVHLIGKTATGRTTIRVLNVNSEDQIALRSS